MSLTSLINHDATIIRRTPGDFDDFSNEKADESSEAILCELQQRARTEPGDSGELSDTEWVAFFLPDAEVHGDDVLVVDGQRYEFVGEPWLARNPRTQAPSHIEGSLRRTAGPAAGS